MSKYYHVRIAEQTRPTQSCLDQARANTFPLMCAFNPQGAETEASWLGQAVDRHWAEHDMANDRPRLTFSIFGGNLSDQ